MISVEMSFFHDLNYFLGKRSSQDVKYLEV